MSNSPRPRRPAMDDYGIPAEMPEIVPPWSAIEDKLAASRNYWIGSTGPGGRPHAMPVWGLYVDHTLYFSTGTKSRKARNLAASPEVNVHLESGDDVVVIEGTVREVAATTLPDSLFDAYNDKYSFRPDATDASGGWFIVEPRRAFTWTEADFVNSALRWDFDPA